MGLAEGLCLYFPKSDFMCPAGDIDCPEAIGRIIKDGQDCTVGGDNTEVRIGYVKYEKVAKSGVYALGKGSGFWDIVKVRQATFNIEKQGWVVSLVIDVQKKGTKKIIKDVTISTGLVFFPDLLRL